jgi:hypothetical protein
MLNNLIKKYIFNSIINNLKGKKRWLVILAFALAQILQTSGVDVSVLADALGNLLQTTEG